MMYCVTDRGRQEIPGLEHCEMLDLRLGWGLPVVQENIINQMEVDEEDGHRRKGTEVPQADAVSSQKVLGFLTGHRSIGRPECSDISRRREM